MLICLPSRSRKTPKTKYFLEVTEDDSRHTEKRSCLFRPQHRGRHSSVHSQACSPPCTRLHVHTNSCALTHFHGSWLWRRSNSGNKLVLHLKWLRWDTLYLHTRTVHICTHLHSQRHAAITKLHTSEMYRYPADTHVHFNPRTNRPLNKNALLCDNVHGYSSLYNKHTQGCGHLR